MNLIKRGKEGRSQEVVPAALSHKESEVPWGIEEGPGGEIIDPEGKWASLNKPVSGDLIKATTRETEKKTGLASWV